MKRTRARTGVAAAFAILAVIAYVAMHVYFTYLAFTSFKLWFAIAVFLVPVLGDMLLLGAFIGSGMWTPAIIFGVFGVLYFIGSLLAPKDKVQ